MLRLESDEALVKIVTMHAAKGLQYPLVYCPFVWDAPSGKPDSWQILHRQDQSEWLAKSQLEEADLQQLAEEEASERLRLLYVALTRAEEQLTLYAAHCDNTAANTFAYLLEGGCDSRFADTAAAYAAEKKPIRQRARKRCCGATGSALSGKRLKTAILCSPQKRRPKSPAHLSPAFQTAIIKPPPCPHAALNLSATPASPA